MKDDARHQQLDNRGSHLSIFTLEDDSLDIFAGHSRI